MWSGSAARSRGWSLVGAMALAACASSPDATATLGEGAPTSCLPASARGLSEVGHLVVAGVERCTATLVSVSSAVTAGHCLPPGMAESSPGDSSTTA